MFTYTQYSKYQNAYPDDFEDLLGQLVTRSLYLPRYLLLIQQMHQSFYHLITQPINQLFSP